MGCFIKDVITVVWDFAMFLDIDTPHLILVPSHLLRGIRITRDINHTPFAVVAVCDMLKLFRSAAASANFSRARIVPWVDTV